MDDTKNMILAIVLSMLVLFGYQYFVLGPEEEQARIQAEIDAANEVDDLSIQPGALSDALSDGMEIPGEVPDGATQVPTEGETAPSVTRIPIDAPRVEGSISPLGGRIDSLILKDYFDTIEPDANNIVLLRKSGTEHAYFSNFGWVQGSNASTLLPDDDTLWQTNGGTLTAGNPVDLYWDNGQGVTFRKFISIDENYMFTQRLYLWLQLFHPAHRPVGFVGKRKQDQFDENRQD